MTKRKQEKEEVENDSPENAQLLDTISEVSKKSMIVSNNCAFSGLSFSTLIITLGKEPGKNKMETYIQNYS